jgi:O-antigen/teichoic acid export membrane protein
LNYGLTHQVIGWGGQRKYALICGAGIPVNLAMNAVLIPALGIAGAAWATLGTEVLLAMGWIWALRSGRRSVG